MGSWIRLAVALAALAWIGGASAEQVTLRMWMHEHPPRVPIDKQIVAEFEKANPDIKVDHEILPVAEYPTKLLTAFAAGSGPDIFNAASMLVAQYYNARILAPIDYAAMGLAGEAAFASKFSSGLDGIRFQGKLYGVPTEVSNWACFTNNTIWREAGLDPDKDFPKTWEAFPAIAEKLTQRDTNGVPRRRGFDFNWPNRATMWFIPNTMLHQLGSAMIDEEKYKATIDTPRARQVFHYLQDWVNKYRLGGPQYTDTRTDFLGGRLATDCSFGIWGIPQMVSAKIDWSVHALPRWEHATSDNGVDAYAYYMMVNARSSPAAQKAAWKLVRFYTDHAAELFAGAGLFVPRKEVTDSDAYKSNPAAPFFLSELKKARFSPRVVGYDQVVDALLRGRDRIMQGDPVDQVLPDMDSDVNTILNRERARAAAMARQ
jgi:multiple sugar transport system substrate-binding protein